MEPLVSGVNIVYKRGLSSVLKNIEFEIKPGRVVGLIGPNGAGKTSLLKTLVGFNGFSGELSVLGQDPRLVGESLFRDIFFLTDTSALPRWIRIEELFDYVAGVHDGFDHHRALEVLSEVGIDPRAHIGKLSKGMVAELYVIIAMAVDSKLLILDEPTLGLDLIFRKRLYSDILEGYMDEDRSVLVSTHEILEVEEILTDVIFIDSGSILLCATMDDLARQFIELSVKSDKLTAAQSIPYVNSRACPGGRRILYNQVDRERLEALGEISVPPLTDIFLAVLAGKSNND